MVNKDNVEVIVGHESTGVFPGVLVEDMIETVKRTGKLYCDVHIKKFYEKNYRHPLTYVPLWAMSLPLKAGDTVYVKFYQDDLTLPVLWKSGNNLPEDFYKQFDFGDFLSGDDHVKKPQAEETLSAQMIGPDSYIIKTESYTVIHQNDGFILIDKNGKTYLYGSELNLVANSSEQGSSPTINLNAKSAVKIYANTNKILLNNTSISIEAQTNTISIDSNGVNINGHLKVTK